MRISTNSIFEANTTSLNSMQAQLAKTQMQIAAQKRILVPSDDPVASARALEVTQAQAMNKQFATNRVNAKSSLSLVEVALGQAGTLIKQAQTLVVSAGNGGMSLADRQAIATELEGRLTDLLAVANTTDGAGGYLFSGYKATTEPFTRSATGATYHGDQGQRELQVGSARKLAVSDSGSAIFENNATGNGKFQTQAGSANKGSGIISSGAVTDHSAYLAHNYSISFTVTGTPAVTTYDIVDNTTGTTVMDDAAFKSGEQITLPGMVFDIEGAPANGDTFTIAPSHKQSVFQTFTELIATLRQPAIGADGQAKLTNGLNTASDNLAASLDNVLSVRASVGARLKEIDYLDSTGDDLNQQYASALSDLQDLDVVAAYSLFTQQQFTLDAAQKSFKAMSGLSLFNYIG